MAERSFLLNHWPAVREDLLLTLESFEDSDLIFVPVKHGWTVGRIMLHIGSAANYWLHSGILSPVNVYQKGESTLEKYPTLDAIRDYLGAEHKRTIELLENFDDADWEKDFQYPIGETYKPSWIFWHVLEHEIHHRGELSLILGLLGREGLYL